MHSRKFIVHFLFSWVFILSPMIGWTMDLQMHPKTEQSASCCDSKEDHACGSHEKSQDSKDDCKKNCKDHGCHLSIHSYSLYFHKEEYRQKAPHTETQVGQNFALDSFFSQNFIFSVWNPPKF